MTKESAIEYMRKQSLKSAYIGSFLEYKIDQIYEKFQDPNLVNEGLLRNELSELYLTAQELKEQEEAAKRDKGFEIAFKKMDDPNYKPPAEKMRDLNGLEGKSDREKEWDRVSRLYENKIIKWKRTS